MAWSFKKRVKIAPGVNLNLSKSGLSTSIGPKGAKVTVGPQGTYLHTSIPGTGIYNRQKISSKNSDVKEKMPSYSSYDNSNGNVFSGCLLSLPRLVIWIAMLIFLFIAVRGIVFGDTEHIWIILSAVVFVAGYIGLREMNGGDSYGSNEKKGCHSVFILLSIIFFGFIGLWLYRVTENQKQAEISNSEQITTQYEDNKTSASTKSSADILYSASSQDAAATEESSYVFSLEEHQYLLTIDIVILVLLILAVFNIGRKPSDERALNKLFSRDNKPVIKEKEKKEDSGQELINKLQKASASEKNKLKRLIIDHYCSVLMLEDAEKRLRPLVNKWIQKVDKNPTEDNKEQLLQHQQELDNVLEEANRMRYDVDGVLSERERQSFLDFCEAFDKLSKCSRIWKVTSSTKSTEYKASAQTTIARNTISLRPGFFTGLDSSFSIPSFPLTMGKIAYIYPRFIIVGNHLEDFDVIPLDSVNFRYRSTRFLEEGFPPSDATRVGKTYRYVNKDGGPDKRYSDNPVIPIYQYGNLTFMPFNITYQISNSNIARYFESAFRIYQNDALLPSSGSTDRSEEIKVDVQNDSLISEQYFNDLVSSIRKLIDFGDTLASNTKFGQIVEETIEGTINWNKQILTKAKDKIPVFLWIDVIHSYLGLGHGLDLSTKEGLGVVLFNSFDLDRSFELEYRFLDYAWKNLRESSEQFTRDSVASMKGDTNLFLLRECLKEYDVQVHNQYVVLLYRYASLIAKVDNHITVKESEWLNSIMAMKLQESDDDVIKPAPHKESQPKSEVKPGPLPGTSAIDELNQLIGLSSVKSEINTLTNYIKVQKMRGSKGMKVSPVSYHCVFTGNPGTGKTTVARIVSEIYKELGILKKGHLIETDRSGLVAEYVGQTAVKTNKIIDSALDGVLFIDEAYSLVDGGNSDYGKEAISTLLKRMEDNRDRLAVILAGYADDMKRFIDSNPGLKSRFNRYIEFPDYTAEELFQIFELNTKKYEYSLTDEASALLKTVLQKASEEKDKRFGNGRFVRNLFEKVVENQANRISAVSSISSESLATIEPDDIMQSV